MKKLLFVALLEIPFFIVSCSMSLNAQLLKLDGSSIILGFSNLIMIIAIQCQRCLCSRLTYLYDMT